MRFILAAWAVAAITGSALLSAGAPAFASLNPLTHCGTERWHIKTLDDTGVNQISNAPESTTISALTNLPTPQNYSPNNDATRYQPVEFDKFTLRALLVGFKEEADRDLHIVIADPDRPSTTMIAEVPDPGCSTMAASGHADQVSRVRESMIRCFGQPPENNRLKKFSDPMLVQIMGIGFFDRLHGQDGLAKNGIELHPVMSIRTLQGTCPTGYSEG